MRLVRNVSLFVGIFVYASAVSAAMTSSNYRINWDTVSVGGLDNASSTSYQLRDTLGNTGIGSSSSTNYGLSGGYRTGVDDQVVSLEVFGQDDTTSEAVSSVTGTTLTVADTTGFTAGDYVAFVQNNGDSQVAAVGKISSLTATTMVLDEFAGGSPAVDGGSDDLVYKLSGAYVSLGTLSTSAVSTDVIGMNITAGVPNGYSVKVASDGLLRSGSNDIDHVSDGDVSAGSEEYGARSSDTSLTDSTFDTQDTAFSTSFQDIATDSSYAHDKRNFLTLKAAISSSTTTGSYSHVLSFILSANY